MAKAAVRYGASLRKQCASVDKQRTAKYPCPQCGKKAVTRKGNAKWECRSCGIQFAGGAYSLSTPIGDATRRLLLNLKKGMAPAAKKEGWAHVHLLQMQENHKVA